MHRGQAVEQLDAVGRQGDVDPAAVGHAGQAHHETLGDQPVAARKAADRQQRLVLLGSDARRPRRLFAEGKEAPQRITERRQHLVLLVADPLRRLDGRAHGHTSANRW